MFFDVPDEQKKWLVENKKEGSAYKIIDGVVYGRMAAACWFTNLDIPKRHEPMLLGWKFEKGLEMGIYQKYDNYDAYNVDKVCQIPRDYDGVLGVPITFLDKYCPEQFEILNANDYRTSDNVPKKSHGLIKDKEGYIRERERATYARICIKRIACTRS